tara:strand:- start:15662 stop:17017 length:1356 start_codon:yes stop_codon:yes gene_type:complete
MNRDAFSEAWSIMKGIVFNGVEYEDIDELDPMIVESLRLLTEEGKALPPPPFTPTEAQKKGSIGVREGTPLMPMRNAVLAGQDPQPIFDAMRGFTDSENNMLTTFINWEGGKTSEMPKFRVMASKLGEWDRPVEPMGGSGSFVLGMNRGTGLINDMNPDIVNIHTQAKRGMGDVVIPQNQQELDDNFAELNHLRMRRDMYGEDMTDEELLRMARLFVGNNLASYRTDWRGTDWQGRTEMNEKGKQVPMKNFEGDYRVPYTEGRYPNQKFRDNSRATMEQFNRYHAQGSWDGFSEDEQKQAKNFRAFPYMSRKINLDAYAPRYKGVDITQGNALDIGDLLRPTDLLYLDPPYISRDMDYGATGLQQLGRTYDDFQRGILRLGREHSGPSILSNYMYAKDKHQPLEEYIKDAIDSGYTIYPWLRKPKANKFPQVEMFGLKGLQMPTTLQQRLF